MILSNTWMRLSRIAAVFVLTNIATGIQAQNLVPNPGFEEVSEDTKEKDMKAFGLVNVHSQEWFGATAVSPDLFMIREKEGKVNIVICYSFSGMLAFHSSLRVMNGIWALLHLDILRVDFTKAFSSH